MLTNKIHYRSDLPYLIDLSDKSYPYITMDTLFECAALPLVEVPAYNSEENHWSKFYNEDQNGEDLTGFKYRPFDDVMCVVKDKSGFSKYVARFTTEEQTVNVMLIDTSPEYTKKTPQIVVVYAQIDRSAFHPFRSESDSVIINRISKINGGSWDTNDETEATGLVANAIYDYCRLLKYANDYNLHACTVEPMNKLKLKNRAVKVKVGTKLSSVRGPKVLYLNDFKPVESDSFELNGSLVTSVTKRNGVKLTEGHPRRAHSKTLRHQKYKNHPLYMIPGAIKVRSTWVGPKTTIVNGNVYRVLVN